MRISMPKPNFNSCMVRLKEIIATFFGITIEFQFLYGAIKRQWLGMVLRLMSDFNSCMVRLKVYGCSGFE